MNVTVFALGVPGALLVHLLAQWVAAKAVGAVDISVAVGWPAIVLRASVGKARELEASVIVAGAMANLGGAGALFSTTDSRMHIAGGLQLGFALLCLLPVGHSDGARLLALRR